MAPVFISSAVDGPVARANRAMPTAARMLQGLSIENSDFGACRESGGMSGYSPPPPRPLPLHRNVIRQPTISGWAVILRRARPARRLHPGQKHLIPRAG